MDDGKYHQTTPSIALADPFCYRLLLVLQTQ